MRDAVIYCRVSSKGQESEGFSIPAQQELLKEYAKRNSLNVVEQFAEAETAKQIGRPQFATMVKFAQKQKRPLVILVEKTDRLYRNFKDFLTIDDLVQNSEIEIHLVKEGEVIGKSASSHTKFIHGIKVLLAKNYIDNLSEEVRKGRRQKVLQGGWHTKAPYGYKNDKNTRTIIPDPDKAPFVIRAFQIYSSGMYSLEATIERLAEEGFIYLPSSQRITRSRIHAMFNNPAYIGKIPFNGEVYEGKHPPLIDLTTWLDARRALQKDNKPASINRRDFVYKGLLTCGECGRQILGEIKKKRYTYYRCGAFKKGCSQGYFPESLLDEAIDEALSSLCISSESKDAIITGILEMQDSLANTANEEADRLHAQIKRLRQKRRSAYEDKQAGHIDFDMWQEIDREYQDQIQALEARQSKIDTADTIYFNEAASWVELPNIISRGWIPANDEEKRLIANLVISNILIKDKKPHIELIPAISILGELSKKEKSREWQDTVRTLISQHSVTLRKIYQALTA